ncbi:ribosomal L1 domain-containing protein 1 [Discoglossus pictus]
MAAPGGHELEREQVKKATQALFAYQKTKTNKNALLLNENDRISLMLTVWKIPKRDQTIKIRLPHGIRPDSCEVCLITRDEPNMSSEQTVKFYKNLLSQHGVTHVNEVIALRTLKKEYKPFEAKRQLLGTYDLFLSDARIRRFLPSLLGKHFYKAKREPLSVNLKTKFLAAELNRFIHGTTLHITSKGCCYSIPVGHTGMSVDEIAENTLAVAEVLATKLPMQWKNVKILHLKTTTSVALPVYHSALGNLQEMEEEFAKHIELNRQQNPGKTKKTKKWVKKMPPKQSGTDSGVSSDASAPELENVEAETNSHQEEEEVPELVPIQEPTKTKKQAKAQTPVKKSKAVGKKPKSTEIPAPAEASPEILKQKRKVSDTAAETPRKQRKSTPAKPIKEEREEQDLVPKGGILKKTPKKNAVKSAGKLTKSAKKAPVTPKLKQKKRMKVPQSV